jgi:hypothetical protein
MVGRFGIATCVAQRGLHLQIRKMTNSAQPTLLGRPISIVDPEEKP